MGHAGSDAETGYRSLKRIEAIEAQDPLLHSARLLIEQNILSPGEIVDRHAKIEEQVSRISAHAIKRPKLQNSDEVMRSIIPPLAKPSAINTWSCRRIVSEQERQQLFEGEKRLLTNPQNMARLINLALVDIMLGNPDVIILGEDVGRKGGVYSVTTGLQKKFGPARVLDTLLDEQSILGLSMGLAHNGFIPIPEIQFLAYVHNAEDQIRGEAATLSFFSDGQYTNPMVIRIAGLAYQKGFGGHFHNDNSFNVFRDIPGIILACPSNGRDAVQMLRTCVELAEKERRVIIYIEPIALYLTRDLHQEGDGLWLSAYESPIDEHLPIVFGQLGITGEGTDLCILTYGNGYYLSCQARPGLEKAGISLRIVDLRWLAPLNEDEIIAQASKCKAVLIVDECRKTGSISEALMTLMMERQVCVPVSRVTAKDSFIPIGMASTMTLPDVEQITRAALGLLEHRQV